MLIYNITKNCINIESKIMIEEYNDIKTYRHEETCTYEGKIWRASCYVGGMTGLNPKDGEGSFWIEEDVSAEIDESLEDAADSAFNVG